MLLLPCNLKNYRRVAKGRKVDNLSTPRLILKVSAKSFIIHSVSVHSVVKNMETNGLTEKIIGAAHKVLIILKPGRDENLVA